jgi:hypothetical protein
MRWTLLVGLVGLLGCGDKDTAVDDSGGDDSADDSGGDDTGNTSLPEWSWCAAGAGVGGGWDGALTISEDALFCGESREDRSLDEEQAAKVQVMLMPSALDFPIEGGSGLLTLPACAAFAPDEEGLQSSGEGVLNMTVVPYGSDTYFNLFIEQPMVGPDGVVWTLRVAMSGTGKPEQLELHGDYGGPFLDPQIGVTLCRGDCGDYTDQRALGSCTFDGVNSQHHDLTFEGGELGLELRIGDSFASTEPAILLKAEGTLNGEPFTQTDYWSLVYNPEHHHFSRDARVWLDQPIGEVCALEALGFDPWGEDPATTVRALGCDGALLSELPLTGEAYTRDE